MYGRCDQQPVRTTQGKTTLDTPNYIELPVNTTGGIDCYVVTASSDTLSVVVEARSTQAGNVILLVG